MIRDDGLREIPGYLRRWRYNTLDAAITLEVADALAPRLEADPNAARYYGFSMAQQAPAFAMMMRGIWIDQVEREAAERAQVHAETEAGDALNALAPEAAKPQVPNPQKCTSAGGAHRWKAKETALDVTSRHCTSHHDTTQHNICQRCGVPRFVPGRTNPNSPPQIKRLFYDVLELPSERNHKDHKISVDDECLERVARKNPTAAPLVDAVLTARGARKQAALLRTRIDDDGRWRYSANVGAAVTGRWSTSDSPRGTGASVQNIADRSRGIFAADPGLVMFYADYEQAESRVVAWDAEDSAYIAAHQTGDVHTEVARLVWPAFFEEHRHDTSPHCTTRNNTTQDNTPQQLTNRQIAELPAPWDANHEIRWYSKHVAHGTAIGMTEHGIARDARIKLKEARAARNEFRSRFPRVAARQDEIWQSVLETRTVTSPLGRRRTFRGRIYGMDAGSTRREALAQIQQSMIVDWVSIALCRVWMEMDGRASTPKPSDPCRVWILAQVHDAILGLVRPGDDEALQRVHELMSFHLDLHGRELRIPVEIKIGPSWKHDAMVKWRPGLTWSNTAR